MKCTASLASRTSNHFYALNLPVQGLYFTPRLGYNVPMAELTPMLKQYFQVKGQHQDCVLFFRLGDFYEMFGDDAVAASKILNITLTARNKGTENETPMCGIPYHAAEGYIAKLTRAGKKVAVCEQVTEPNSKGIVEREVVRIVTPGTTLDDAVLEGRENNYLASVSGGKDGFALAYLDLTTGEFRVAESADWNSIADELSSLRPAEILHGAEIERQKLIPIQGIGFIQLVKSAIGVEPKEIIMDFFEIKSLEPISAGKLSAGLVAASRIISYVRETQKTNVNHIRKLIPYKLDQTMLLDQSTIRNLEIFYNNQTFSREGSLLGVLDQTRTAMGGRLLRKFLAHPLTSLEMVESRHSAVDEIFRNYELRSSLTEMLSNLSDLERIIGRLGCARFNARDLVSLNQSLSEVPAILSLISHFPTLSGQLSRIKPLPQLTDLLSRSLADEPPILVTIGGMIRAGYNAELDELRSISSAGKEFIASLQAREIERTGISSLKIKFNGVFGYYIEISKTNLNQVPSDYERKQTLVNAERFTIPELKEYEQKVLTAEDRIKDLEYRILLDVRNEILQSVNEIQSLAQDLAYLDVLNNFANIAVKNSYVKPEMDNGYGLTIVQGRHPVIEALHAGERYIPNDAVFNEADHQLILLTGPNMAGKSSFLRQIALIALMAQAGSFVPAESARIGICDRIFTRVGASDNLVQGQSTFMVEMQEAANIINSATGKSLIIFDELGRGTSTFDGISIAWAVAKYIHDHLKAKTIFATHYHELIDLADSLPYAKNYSLAVQEENNELIFLRKVIPQPIGKSYGIQVAKLAGLPNEIILKAYEMLAQLESKQGVVQTAMPLAMQEKVILENPVISEIKSLNLDNISPIEAWQLIKKIQDEIN